MKAPISDAKVWCTGKRWAMHARHPYSGAWIRQMGLATERDAIVEADAACLRLDREYEERAA